MQEIPVNEIKGFWFHVTNGVTLHIGTNNSSLTKSRVNHLWNWAVLFNIVLSSVDITQ